jgi:hypothetical protein
MEHQQFVVLHLVHSKGCAMTFTLIQSNDCLKGQYGQCQCRYNLNVNVNSASTECHQSVNRASTERQQSVNRASTECL